MAITDVPNNGFRNGNRNGSASQGFQSNMTGDVPNRRLHDGDRGGSYPQGGQGMPAMMQGSNPGNKFNISNAKMKQPPSAIQPGNPAIPVESGRGPNGSTVSDFKRGK
jgi:hypothetical protein